MSRKNRVKESLLAKHRKKQARMHKSNKAKYISKAERAKIEAEQTTQMIDDKSDEFQ